MSAFLVSKSHVDALVAIYATDRKRAGKPVTPALMTSLGAMLVAANVYSIESRYPDTKGKPEEMPGPNIDNPDRAFADGYTWAPVKAEITPVGALALLACYDYQTCEFPDYETSDAALFCKFLKARLLARFFPGYEGPVSGLPGFDSAPWGL